MACTDCGSLVADCGCEGSALPVIQGTAGTNGQSAYVLWLGMGNVGSVSDFIASLAGTNGMSAYEVAVDNGFVGNEAAWLASLVGTDGDDGDPGVNGVNAFGYVATQSPQPQMPAVDAVVAVELIAASGGQTQWAVVGQPIWVETWGTMIMHTAAVGDVLTLRNPGYPQNAAPGSTLAANRKVAPTGFNGEDGDSVTGPIGPAPEIPGFIGTFPTAEPAPQAYTAFWIDTSVSPAVTYLIIWNTLTDVYDIVSTMSGTPGSRILFPGVDPNTLPSNYGNDTDVAFEDDSNPGSWTMWQRTGPGTWTTRGMLSVGTVSALFDMFRAGKTAAQPIPMGTTTGTVVQFELTSGLGFYNGGWWGGNLYDASTGITTPMRFLLNNLRIYRTTGSGENIDFTVDIRVKGVSEATGTIALLVADDEGTLVVLDTDFLATDASTYADVLIRPSVAPTEQWYIDFTGTVFYNQK